MGYDTWKQQTPPQFEIDTEEIVYEKCDLCLEDKNVDELHTFTFMGNVLHRCTKCNEELKKINQPNAIYDGNQQNTNKA